MFFLYACLSPQSFASDVKIVHNKNCTRNCQQTKIWREIVNKQKSDEILSTNKKILWHVDAHNMHNRYRKLHAIGPGRFTVPWWRRRLRWYGNDWVRVVVSVQRKSSEEMDMLMLAFRSLWHFIPSYFCYLAMSSTTENIIIVVVGNSSTGTCKLYHQSLSPTIKSIAAFSVNKRNSRLCSKEGK
jgi:hypothetical protein